MNHFLRSLTAGLSLVALAARPPLAVAQTGDMLDTDKKIIEFAKSNSQLMDNLEYLSDMIGPRLTGSASLKKANDWTAQKMKEYGLENVHLEEWTIPQGWERGKCEVKLLEPQVKTLMAASWAWCPGTEGTVTGSLVYLPSDAKLDDYKGKLKNAIVMMSRPSSPNHHPSRTDPNARRGIMGTEETEEGENAAILRLLQSRNEFLRAEGVAATLMDSGKPQMLLNMSGNWDSRPNAPKKLPLIVMANEHYSMLYRLAQHKVPVTLSVNIENKFIDGPIKVYNTVGEIKGSEKPDEMVLCGAHLDSWDLGNGTTDNGTGSMVVLETARLMKAMNLKPKRTVRFVLFSGEEQGLFGSQEYVKAHKQELAKVSAVFVHDTGTGKITGIGLHGNKQAKPALEPEFTVLKDLGVTNYSEFMMGGTDHASFYTSYVPGFWFMQDSADYGLMHHSQSDTFDKALKDDLIQGATVMTICAYNVAQMPTMLPRRESPKATSAK